MSRIASRFAALKREGRGALIPFIEAWDPDAATSLALLRGMWRGTSTALPWAASGLVAALVHPDEMHLVHDLFPASYAFSS